MTLEPRLRFNVDRYVAMHEKGIIPEDMRVELLDGEILQMSPIGSRHAFLVARLHELLYIAVHKTCLIYDQNPLELSDKSMPQPDLMVLRKSKKYLDALPIPNDVLLLIEVSDSSARYDRQEKLPRYAEAGLTEVWLVDAEQSTVEQYTSPLTDRYANLVIHQLQQTISSHNLPELKLALTEIFESAEGT